MFIYKITRNERVSWDEYAGHIVVAHNSDQVRRLAAETAECEGPNAWAPGRATVVKLGTYTKNRKTPYITLSDFHAG